MKQKILKAIRAGGRPTIDVGSGHIITLGKTSLAVHSTYVDEGHVIACPMGRITKTEVKNILAFQERQKRVGKIYEELSNLTAQAEELRVRITLLEQQSIVLEEEKNILIDENSPVVLNYGYDVEAPDYIQVGCQTIPSSAVKKIKSHFNL